MDKSIVIPTIIGVLLTSVVVFAATTMVWQSTALGAVAALFTLGICAINFVVAWSIWSIWCRNTEEDDHVGS